MLVLFMILNRNLRLIGSEQTFFVKNEFFLNEMKRYYKWFPLCILHIFFTL